MEATSLQRLSARARLGVALFGDVWLCRDEGDNDRLVAVKQVSLTLARLALAENAHLDNPWRERRVLAALTRLGPHENVVTVRQDFVLSDTWFLVMEYCDGGDLWTLLQTAPNHRLPEAAALSVLREVVNGVRFLHMHGFAHRDLSLENVLLSAGTCKLCDFGLTIKAGSMSNDVVGKAYYMAPEVVAGEYYDSCAADMWALGIILFVVLTGSPLTPRASPDEKAFVALREFGAGAILDTWGMSSQMSLLTVDLLDGLLQVDPVKRLSILDVVMHPVMRSS